MYPRSFSPSPRKALVIIGSPRPHGNTARMTERLLEGMEQQGIQISSHVLGDMDIRYCLGCKTCYTQPNCVQQDDMGFLIRELMDADIIAIAAPSYWGDVPGQLKVFIDRCLPLCDARTGTTPVPPGKIALSLAIRAGSRPEENQHLLDTMEHFFGHLQIPVVQRFSLEGVDTEEDLTQAEDKLAKVYELGRHILQYLPADH